MACDRRMALKAGIAGALAAGLAPAKALAAPFRPLLGPRARVMFVNDLSGDIDGLFAAVHMILSPSVELRGIIGTATFSPWFKDETAARSAELANDILRLMGRAGKVPVHAGADRKMPGPTSPVRSAGAEAIIAEAMRSDTALPLYVAVGGGLNEVASALLIEPAIASRFTLVWIGGDSLPGGGTGETNFNIDAHAARYIYNETTLPVWQVTRKAYSTCLVSASELAERIGGCGRIGPWLIKRLDDVAIKSQRNLNTGETWILGDNPLVLLTALTDWVPSSGGLNTAFRFERTASSPYTEVIAPLFNPDGTFTARTSGRTIRVYDAIDVRTMHGDMFAKLRLAYPPR
jgi:purine nucleosidase